VKINGALSALEPNGIRVIGQPHERPSDGNDSPGQRSPEEGSLHTAMKWTAKSDRVVSSNETATGAGMKGTSSRVRAAKREKPRGGWCQSGVQEIAGLGESSYG